MSSLPASTTKKTPVIAKYVPPHRRRANNNETKNNEECFPNNQSSKGAFATHHHKHNSDPNLTNDDGAPIIVLTEDDVEDNDEQSIMLWKCLKRHGYAIVQAPDVLPLELCQKALQSTSLLMCSEQPTICRAKKYITNKKKLRGERTGYKDSVMLNQETSRIFVEEEEQDNADEDEKQHIQSIRDIWNALQIIKVRVLQMLDQQIKARTRSPNRKESLFKSNWGSNLENLVDVHKPETDSLRLIRYPPITAEVMEWIRTKNKCRCHSHKDYGTIALSISSKTGLEVNRGGASTTWEVVPHIPGTVVVMAGKELEKLTRCRDKKSPIILHAPYHRVPGPNSAKAKVEDRTSERHSIILFVERILGGRHKKGKRPVTSK